MYFPDHWALALACPNVPVVIDYLLERIPPVQNAYVQLMDHLTLENIKREDTFTRFPEPDHAISFVWALLNPAFDMHGVRLQYEALYLGGMRDAEDTSAFVPREPDNLLKLLELVPADYVAPPVQSPSFVDFRPSTAIKPLKQHMHYVADAPHYTFKMSKEAIWLNKASVTFYPQSTRGPFKVAVTKPVVQRADFQFEHHVSIAWMLRQYHPMYLAMAREQLWRPDCFTENAVGGMPGFRYVEGNSGDLVIEWKHGQPNKEVKCGAAPGVSDAGCVRDALAIALRVYAPQDEAVHAEIKTWEAWVDWSHLPKRVESLNQVSAFNNVHNLMTLKENDNLKLPVTRSGRSYLFEAGFRSLLLRPMAPVNGWSQHCIPLTASAAGVWSVHDPNEVVLLDAIPGVVSLEGRTFYGSVPGEGAM